MRYGQWILVAGIVLALASSAYGQTSCYIVDPTGREHRIPDCSRLVAREIEVQAGKAGQETVPEPQNSPTSVRAFVFQGTVIPIRQVRYMFPTLGIYVLGSGATIEAGPLGMSGLSREHRIVDLEHPRHRSTAAGLGTESHPDHPLRLEVFVEFASVDTVAGFETREPRAALISDAWIVVFDPEAIEEARDLWSRLAESEDASVRFSPYMSLLGRRVDLLDAPEGKETANLRKGARVRVLEIRDDWARVEIEGWVKTATVQEKSP
jgi:hypothetical protein